MQHAMYTNDYRMVTMNDQNGRYTLAISCPQALLTRVNNSYSHGYIYKGNVHHKPTPTLAFINSVLLESNISLAK